MLVIWKPEDGSDDQQWHFDPDDVDSRRAMEIESHYDGDFDSWVLRLRTGNMKARRALLWYMLTQIHPKLQFRDVPAFRVRQLKVEMTVAELKELYPKALAMTKPEDVEQLEMAFKISIQEASEREGLDVDVSFNEGRLAIEGVDLESSGPKEVA